VITRKVRGIEDVAPGASLAPALRGIQMSRMLKTQMTRDRPEVRTDLRRRSGVNLGH